MIVITGPTAVGKTALSIELARKIGGEIISADSMQVYKYMDIGTAKPSVAERKSVPHYLIDELTPDEEFSVAKFCELAGKYIKKISSLSKIPIVAGGTGLYINSLINNIRFPDDTADKEYRIHLKHICDERGKAYLYDELKRTDPEAAFKIHPNDTKRIIRALEVFERTGIRMSRHAQLSCMTPPEFRFVMIGLNMNRELLYDRINRRVDTMFEKGLVNEVRHLIKMGYSKHNTAMQGLGYKEIVWYLDGEASIAEAADLLKKNTRHFAKRQMTWFKRMTDIRWFDVDASDDSEILNIVYNCIASTGIIM